MHHPDAIPDPQMKTTTGSRFSAENGGYYTTVVDLSPVVISKTDECRKIGPRHQFKNVT